jgi:hypothetical protein
MTLPMIVAHIEYLVSDFISKLLVRLKTISGTREKATISRYGLPFPPQYPVAP